VPWELDNYAEGLNARFECSLTDYINWRYASPRNQVSDKSMASTQSVPLPVVRVEITAQTSRSFDFPIILLECELSGVWPRG
jgi:hypothetical protein